MTTLHLTEHGALLLPSQLALNGTFNHRLVRRGYATQILDIVPLALHVDQGQHAIHLTLSVCSARHSWSLAKAEPRKMAEAVRRWIEDCANGRQEEAA